MELKKMTKVELETLSYTDLTYMILKEEKKTMNTPTIFRMICSLLEYSDQDFENKIGDYYTSLTLDKRFILLEDATWDLREKHSIELDLDEEEEDIVDESEIEDEEDDSEELEEDDDLDEETDEDLSDLAIVDDDFDEENED